MTTITNQTIRNLRPEIEHALKEVGDRFGIDFKLGRGKYSRSGVSGSLELEMAARDLANGKPGAQVLFEQQAPSYGLTSADYEREFTQGRRRFKLIGFHPNSRVNCLSIACVKSGTEYVLDLDSYKKAVLYEEVISGNKKAA